MSRRGERFKGISGTGPALSRGYPCTPCTPSALQAARIELVMAWGGPSAIPQGGNCMVAPANHATFPPYPTPPQQYAAGAQSN